MTSTPHEDPELTAMAHVLKVLQSLEDPEAQRRVLSWVSVRLSINATRREQAPPKADSYDTDTPDATVVREGTINTVATKLGVSSCRSLLVAAAAYLTVFQGKERFSRQELAECAKEARMWKGAYTAQISINLARMCESDELMEKSKNVFGLSPKKLTELEGQLTE